VAKRHIVAKSRKKRHLGKKLEEFDRKERESRENSSYRELDFTDHAPAPVLEDEYFGGFQPSEKQERDEGPGGHRLWPEQRGFSRYRQPDPGWAARQEAAWPPFVVKALWEAHQREHGPPEPPIFVTAPPYFPYFHGSPGKRLERAALYATTGRWIEASEKLEPAFTG
jgi:hypothetical protein